MKNASPKPIIRRRGNMEVTISYEPPRGNRKPWRLSWVENGVDQSEMFATLEEAKTQAEIKLASLSSGQVTMTKEEIDDLFGFKKVVEDFNRRLAPHNRTLDDVISDVIAAAQIQPGMTAAAMAQFICSNHGVEHPMSAQEVKVKYLEHLRSDYKRKYSVGYVNQAERHLDRFCANFGERRLDTLVPGEILDFIKGFRVRPKRRSERSKADQEGLVPAGQKTRNHLHNSLDQMFAHAKTVLQALPPRLETAVRMVAAPQFITPTPEVYTPAELVDLYRLLPDIECVLYVSLQLFAGLRPCEAAKIRLKDIKRDPKGQPSYILVRQEVMKKTAQPGRKRIRTRKAPITRPLAKLLAAIQLPKGALFLSKGMEGRVCGLARTARFPWKHDGLRHSFISYRLEQIKDRSTVAYEAGHDVDMQIEHYEGLVDSNDVPAYWAFKIKVEGLPYTANELITRGEKPGTEPEVAQSPANPA
jgi:integrase